jgi:L-cysteine desulfidase
MIDLIQKIQNFDLDDETLLDENLILNAVGLALGPPGIAGIALLTAIKKANQMNSVISNLVEVIKDICNDSDIDINETKIKELLNKKIQNNNKEVLSKIAKYYDLDIVDITIDERWA